MDLVDAAASVAAAAAAGKGAGASRLGTVGAAGADAGAGAAATAGTGPAAGPAAVGAGGAGAAEPGPGSARRASREPAGVGCVAKGGAGQEGAGPEGAEGSAAPAQASALHLLAAARVERVVWDAVLTEEGGWRCCSSLSPCPAGPAHALPPPHTAPAKLLPGVLPLLHCSVERLLVVLLKRMFIGLLWCCACPRRPHGARV